MPVRIQRRAVMNALSLLSLLAGPTAFAHRTAAQDVSKSAPEIPNSAAKPQTPGRAADGNARPPQASQTSTQSRQLPADSTTSHSLELPGRMLNFRATAGSIPLAADDGTLTAELGYIAYQLDGSDTRTRPVTFLFNGGPGSASAWVHIIGFGPWRLPADASALSPSAPPVLVPNAETWLEFTDLVFIDPAGTGFSRIARATDGAAASASGSGSSRQRGGSFYSVNGDADSIADMIAKWLRKHDRLISPKVIVGESYGGIRAPKVAYRLQTQNGVGLSAIVLLSPVMDFGLFRGPRHHLNAYVNSLPTIAAAAREAKGQPFKSRDDLAEVETYARGEYLLDLMRGPRDAAAVERVVKRVAEISNLPPAVVRQYDGRLDEFIYIRESNRDARTHASGYDTSVIGDDPDPSSYFKNWDDPFASALAAPVTGAMINLYTKLGWRTDLSYNLAAGDALASWQWGNSSSSVESFSQLKAAMALDPKLRLLVTHGATDLRTPYLGSVLLLDQLPAFADKTQGRVAFRLYPGGHMHYTRHVARKALQAEMKDLIEKVVGDASAQK
jgi:carboxypeptidase C (cathepsin A)